MQVCFDTNIWFDVLTGNKNSQSENAINKVFLRNFVITMRGIADTLASINHNMNSLSYSSVRALNSNPGVTVKAKPIKILIPRIVYLELMENLIETKTMDYLIKKGGYNSARLRGNAGKKLIANTTLPKNMYKKEIIYPLKLIQFDKDNVLLQKSTYKLDFDMVEDLVKNKVGVKDAIIAVEANGLGSDYLVTRDEDLRKKINSLKTDLKWIKIDAISPSGIIKILEMHR